MSTEFKQLADVPVLAELSENAHVIVENDGVTRRYPAAGIGGSASTATIFTKDWDEELGEDVCKCNKTFAECLEDYNNGNLNAFAKDVLASGYHAAMSYEYSGYEGYEGELIYRFYDFSYGANAIVTYFPDGTVNIGDNINGGE